jgi:predicted membrane protein
MDSIFWFLIIPFSLPLLNTTAIMTLIQYKYIKTMEDSQKRRKQILSEMYEEMPVQEDVLHMNLQSNPLFLPANILAGIIYKLRHR